MIGQGWSVKEQWLQFIEYRPNVVMIAEDGAEVLPEGGGEGLRVGDAVLVSWGSGARNVLREKDVDFAILETARGGLLRRGLGVERADAALINNIAKDHLGDFGSRNLDELLGCKWIVSRAVRASGKLVLNADDARLVARSGDYDGEIVWFSLHADHTIVTAHVAAGGTAAAGSGTATRGTSG